MQHPASHGGSGKKSTLLTEFLIGLVAIALGGFNLAYRLNLIKWGFEIPPQVGDVILVLVGLFLWMTAYKLWSHRYHTSRLF